ncbi:short-chain collagen C4-like [Mercenaria mercenaria]|uniref:short-chain collagen C4-like n=1 Tax=Mercenaria mercenaria TaxID=6596 RepID=UPI00234E603B|nr:short-chain collagen C4-like [Mercenaria mercenaria]
MKISIKCLLLIIAVFCLKNVSSHNDRKQSGSTLFEILRQLEQFHEAIGNATKILKTQATAVFGENRGSDPGASSHGGNYVRWGKTECPKGVTTVYPGVAGGSFFDHSGAASNYLCLPLDPDWTNKTKNDNTKNSMGAHVYGAEYELDGVNTGFFGGKIQQYPDDVPCAVCETERPNVLMIPGKTTCYEGWNVEYTGYLSAGHYGHKAASEFICLDENPDAADGNDVNENGKLLYLAEARCGSLPCPPYVDGRIMSCVVCSK